MVVPIAMSRRRPTTEGGASASTCSFGTIRAVGLASALTAARQLCSVPPLALAPGAQHPPVPAGAATRRRDRGAVLGAAAGLLPDGDMFTSFPLRPMGVEAEGCQWSCLATGKGSHVAAVTPARRSAPKPCR